MSEVIESMSRAWASASLTTTRLTTDKARIRIGGIARNAP